MTNFDKIKSMSLDEMTEFLNRVGHCSCCVNEGKTDECSLDCCKSGVKEFLKQEIGTCFKELKRGDMFQAKASNKTSLYVKIDNCCTTISGCVYNAINLLSGEHVFFTPNETIYPKALKSITFYE